MTKDEVECRLRILEFDLLIVRREMAKSGTDKLPLWKKLDKKIQDEIIELTLLMPEDEDELQPRG